MWLNANMGRHRTRLILSSRELHNVRRLHQTTGDRRLKERLQFALRAATGRETLEDLAHHLGRSRATIQNWLAKFEADGIAGLLDRATPPGMLSPLSGEEIQAQFKAGLESGRWRSASEIATWLATHHGIERSRKSIYYWIRKLDSRRRRRKQK
jgi:transposase